MYCSGQPVELVYAESFQRWLSPVFVVQAYTSKEPLGQTTVLVASTATSSEPGAIEPVWVKLYVVLTPAFGPQVGVTV